MSLSARTVLPGRACVRIFSANLVGSGNAFEQRAIHFAVKNGHRIYRNGKRPLACKAASFAHASYAAHIGGQKLTSESKNRSLRMSFTTYF